MIKKLKKRRQNQNYRKYESREVKRGQQKPIERRTRIFWNFPEISGIFVFLELSGIFFGMS